MAKYEQGTIVASAGLEGFPLNPAEVKTFSTPPVWLPPPKRLVWIRH